MSDGHGTLVEGVGWLAWPVWPWMWLHRAKLRRLRRERLERIELIAREYIYLAIEQERVMRAPRGRFEEPDWRAVDRIHGRMKLAYAALRDMVLSEDA